MAWRPLNGLTAQFVRRNISADLLKWLSSWNWNPHTVHWKPQIWKYPQHRITIGERHLCNSGGWFSSSPDFETVAAAGILAALTRFRPTHLHGCHHLPADAMSSNALGTAYQHLHPSHPRPQPSFLAVSSVLPGNCLQWLGLRRSCWPDLFRLEASTVQPKVFQRPAILKIDNNFFHLRFLPSQWSARPQALGTLPLVSRIPSDASSTSKYDSSWFERILWCVPSGSLLIPILMFNVNDMNILVNSSKSSRWMVWPLHVTLLHHAIPCCYLYIPAYLPISILARHPGHSCATPCLSAQPKHNLREEATD